MTDLTPTGFVRDLELVGCEPRISEDGIKRARCPSCRSTKPVLLIDQKDELKICCTSDAGCDDTVVVAAVQELKNRAARLPEVPRIRAVSAADLQHKEFGQLVWVLRDLLAEGLTLCSGAAKVGKTTLLVYIAVMVALGRPVLGRKVNPRGVLLLLLEDPWRRIKERITRLLGDNAWPANLYIVSMGEGFPTLGNGAEERLEDFLEEHPDVRFVGIDILNRILPPRKRGANIYEEDVQRVKWLHKLANDRHCAIMALHHDNQSRFNDDFVNAASGSTGLTGTCDAVWNFKRARFEKQSVLSITGREFEEQQLVLQREGFIFQPVGSDPREVGMSKARREIVELLRSDTAGLWPRELAAALEKKEGTIRMAIKRMVESGILNQDSYGKYRLSPAYTHSYEGDGGE